MNKKDILALLKQGESQLIEFKSSFNKSVIECLVAFANTQGGVILIGVNDNAKAIGITLAKESIQEWINQIKQNTTPSLIPDFTVAKIDGKNIVVIEIKEFPVKPVSTSGKYFKRSGNSTHKMDLPEISNMHLQTMNLSWDFSPDPNHNIEDISLTKINLFIERSNLLRDFPVTDDPLTVLNKYELLRNDNITFGCFLGKLPHCLKISKSRQFSKKQG